MHAEQFEERPPEPISDFAPGREQIARRYNMSRRAISGLTHRSQSTLFDRLGDRQQLGRHVKTSRWARRECSCNRYEKTPMTRMQDQFRSLTVATAGARVEAVSRFQVQIAEPSFSDACSQYQPGVEATRFQPASDHDTGP
jgi:hypothetical protein